MLNKKISKQVNFNMRFSIFVFYWQIRKAILAIFLRVCLVCEVLKGEINKSTKDRDREKKDTHRTQTVG
jgi:hypothetical protein